MAAKAAPAGKSKKAKTKKDSPKKHKHVRECFFTFPESDYEALTALKKRALDAGQVVKKTELLRAGLVLLAALNDADLLGAVDRLPNE